jgi:hypothetical protein
MDVGAAASRGLVIVPDATNLNIRFGSNANAFAALNKTTGTAAALTNANWSGQTELSGIMRMFPPLWALTEPIHFQFDDPCGVATVPSPRCRSN